MTVPILNIEIDQILKAEIGEPDICQLIDLISFRAHRKKSNICRNSRQWPRFEEPAVFSSELWICELQVVGSVRDRVRRTPYICVYGHLLVRLPYRSLRLCLSGNGFPVGIFRNFTSDGNGWSLTSSFGSALSWLSSVALRFCAFESGAWTFICFRLNWGFNPASNRS